MTLNQPKLSLTHLNLHTIHSCPLIASHNLATVHKRSINRMIHSDGGLSFMTCTSLVIHATSVLSSSNYCFSVLGGWRWVSMNKRKEMKTKTGTVSIRQDSGNRKKERELQEQKGWNTVLEPIHPLQANFFSPTSRTDGSQDSLDTVCGMSLY